MARRTILVPIDLHGITRDAMETVVRLARQLDRPLLGLVLEDVRLQQVAALPFATEITLLGGRERSLLRDHLSQRHSLVSGDSRRLLHELAHREQVELVFETSSGTRLHCALERGGQLDVFFPARQRWQRARPSRPANGRPFQRLGLVLAGCEQDARVLEAAALLLRAQLVADVYVLSVGRLDRSLLEGLYLPGSRIDRGARDSALPVRPRPVAPARCRPGRDSGRLVAQRRNPRSRCPRAPGAARWYRGKLVRRWPAGWAGLRPPARR